MSPDKYFQIKNALIPLLHNLLEMWARNDIPGKVIIEILELIEKENPENEVKNIDEQIKELKKRKKELIPSLVERIISHFKKEKV